MFIIMTQYVLFFIYDHLQSTEILEMSKQIKEKLKEADAFGDRF